MRIKHKINALCTIIKVHCNEDLNHAIKLYFLLILYDFPLKTFPPLHCQLTILIKLHVPKSNKAFKDITTINH